MKKFQTKEKNKYNINNKVLHLKMIIGKQKLRINWAVHTKILYYIISLLFQISFYRDVRT